MTFFKSWGWTFSEQIEQNHKVFQFPWLSLHCNSVGVFAMMQWIKHHRIKLIKFCFFVNDTAVHLLWSCMHAFILCLNFFMVSLLEWSGKLPDSSFSSLFCVLILHLKGPPIGLGGERFPARRLSGILMGFSWENCPQNGPLHRCLCFRSAVLRVPEGVRCFGNIRSGQTSSTPQTCVLMFH